MTVITSVPHQTAADGSQYAVTTKEAAKVGHVNDNDYVNQKGEDQEVRMYIVTFVCTYVCMYIYSSYVMMIMYIHMYIYA